MVLYLGLVFWRGTVNVSALNKNITERVLKESKYIIEHKDTVRSVAKVFKVSKSTVHKDMQERLKEIDKNLYKQVKKIFNYHIKTRHINGGKATMIKYLKLKDQK